MITTLSDNMCDGINLGLEENTLVGETIVCVVSRRLGVFQSVKFITPINDKYVKKSIRLFLLDNVDKILSLRKKKLIYVDYLDSKITQIVEYVGNNKSNVSQTRAIDLSILTDRYNMT